MSDALKSSRAKIRTFAHDLAVERQKQGHAPKSPAEKEKLSATPLPVPEEQSKKKEPAKPEIKKPKPIEEPLIKVGKKKDESKKKPKRKKPVPRPIIITEPKEKPVPKMPDAPKSTAPIPSFHEIQKTSKKGTHGKRPNIGYDATVITDTKRKRFKLFPALFSSIRSWFVDVTKKKPKAEPKYSVPETTHRKGVIQKATTKSGVIFSADSDTIKEHIRRRQQKEEQAAVEVPQTEEEHAAETSWSPFTDTGYALLDDGEEEMSIDSTFDVTVEHKNFSKDSHVVASPEADNIPKPDTSATDQQPEPLEQEEGIEDTITDTTTQAENEDLAEARWAATNEGAGASQPSDVVSEPAPTLEPEPETAPNPAPSEPEKGFLHQFDTNTLALVLLVIVIGFVTILLISRVALNYINQQDEAVQNSLETSTKEPVLSGAQVVELRITNANIDRLADEAIKAATSAPVGLVEMPVVSPIGDEISPSYFFELMHYQTSPPLRQVVTTARFVTVNRSVPAVLLHFTDRETMQGEMLRWEPILAENFKKLYELPEIGLGSFEDSSIEGVEVRSISHEGERVLIYGFIGSNTLLIANSSATFAQIKQLSDQD